MKKTFIQEQDLLDDAYRLAVTIYESGYRPDFIVGLWRGGSTVGIYVQECLQYLGVPTDHIAIRTSYRGREDYLNRVEQGGEIRVHGLQYLYETLEAHHSLLIVDDVCSTGASIQTLISKLQKKTRRNMPEVKVAAVYYRQSHKTELLKPDYYLRKTDDWLVLPYELSGVSRDDVAEHKTWLLPLLDKLKPGWS